MSNPSNEERDEAPYIFDSEKRIVMYAFELLEKAQEEKFSLLVAERLVLAEEVKTINWENEKVAQAKLKVINLLSEAQDKTVERRMNADSSV
jgi:hypothetical protein